MTVNLDRLNERQKEAAIHVNGPMLIIAGAGSGKTATMTTRTSYLINVAGIRPQHILAVTFTNKAAKEMKERISNVVGEEGKDVTVATFHSFCSRLLRREIRHLGYNSRYSIFDSDDAKSVVKACVKELELDEKKFSPRIIQSWISSFKNSLVNPEDLGKIISWVNRPMAFPELTSYVDLPKAEKALKTIPDFMWSTILEVYKRYQRKLESCNAVDFDDLIFLTVRLFAENPEVLNLYQDFHRYIMIDEYQDTNHAQYVLSKQLAAKYRNLAVVGDDDQGIYGFRSADITNILNFEKDYPESKIVSLEQNYRSTPNILNLANKVITNNSERRDKKLWTDKNSGKDITYQVCFNSDEEARYVIGRIRDLVSSGQRKLSDFAILYRVNAQSRLFEEVLMREGLAYDIVGSTNFYQRMEIKDLIAYMRVMLNPHDNVSLQRIINAPRRGIGNTTINKALQFADQNNTSLWTAFNRAEEYLKGATLVRIQQAVESFQNMMNQLELFRVGEFAEVVVDESGYRKSLEMDKSQESEDRLANVQEFLNVAWAYQEENEEPTLEGLLERIALVSDSEVVEGEDNIEMEKMQLMTVHASKGLEFPVVFIVGVEENMIPYYRSIDDNNVEEERRLCYVAITRAEEELFVTRSIERRLFNQVQTNLPSRFLYEMEFERRRDEGNPFAYKMPW